MEIHTPIQREIRGHTMQMRTSGLTDTGRARSNNEDSYVIEEPLLVVADGMGGAAAGEVASSVTVETIASAFRDKTDISAEHAQVLLEKAILAADDTIHKMAAKNTDQAGMGTTVVAAVKYDDRVLIGFVGDSRAYCISGTVETGHEPQTQASAADAPTVMLKKVDDQSGKPVTSSIKRLTQDHSVVMNLVSAGVITEEDIRSHPLRNRITKCVGSLGDLRPDFLWFTPEDGDILLLCSDGLWEMVHEDIMLAVVKSSSTPFEMCKRLIAAANDAGGHDNITVIIAVFEK